MWLVVCVNSCFISRRISRRLYGIGKVGIIWFVFFFCLKIISGVFFLFYLWSIDLE